MSRSKRQIAEIRGMGAVTPLGVGVPAYIAGLRAGRSGVRPLDFRHELMKSSVAARCPDFEPRRVMSDADLARLPRMIPMALAAAREAMDSAGIPTGDGLDLERSRSIGLVLGTGAGGIDFTLEQSENYHAKGIRPSLWTITNATHGNLAGELSIRLGLRGPSLCVSTGCASASDAVGLALEMLRSDRPGSPRAMVAVGADAHVCMGTLVGMELLRVISTRDYRADPENAPAACKPFDKRRDGFVLGEGAWAVVVTREDWEGPGADRRVGTVRGYGVTCDAFHRVRPDPDMLESVRAMHLAIEDAAMAPQEIEVVHYHGTGTQLNDAVETQAVKIAFGAHAARLRGQSVKGAIGHPQGACGLGALVATLGALTNADGGDGPFLPPTINLHEPDPACDLDYTPNQAAPTDARTALINCLAFGAKNSALVVSADAPGRGR